MAIEYRSASGGIDGEGNSLSGLVTPFNDETTIGDMKRGGFREQVAPGAFTKTLQERDVVMLLNHDEGLPLARVSAGNLRLYQRSDGLHAEAEPVDTTYAQDLLKLTRARVVKGMSFGFEVLKDTWTDDEGRASDSSSGTKRTIHEVRLHEVSCVTFPAYQNTTLAARDSISAARGIQLDRTEETRDAIDGDDVHAEFYNLWSNGAIQNLKVVADTGQLPSNVVTAMRQIIEFCAGETIHVPDDDGHGDVSAQGEGSQGGQSYQENSVDDEWELRARMQMIKAQHNLAAIEFGL